MTRYDEYSDEGAGGAVMFVIILVLLFGGVLWLALMT